MSSPALLGAGWVGRMLLAPTASLGRDPRQRNYLGEDAVLSNTHELTPLPRGHPKALGERDTGLQQTQPREIMLLNNNADKFH